MDTTSMDTGNCIMIGLYVLVLALLVRDVICNDKHDKTDYRDD